MKRFLLVLFAAACITGCAALSDAVRPGTPRAQVLEAWGSPSAVYGLAGGGTRLQYSRQPLGREVYNIDLDASDRVASFEQALQPSVLAQVQAGTWTVDDVRRRFGLPFQVSRVGDFNGDVWTYRYQELNNPRQFHVYLDAAGVVRRAHPSDEVMDRRMRF